MRVVLSLVGELFQFATDGREPVCTAIAGERNNTLANAITMLPSICEQLVSAGATELVLGGDSEGGRLPASAWCLLVPKGDAELEASRLHALAILEQGGVRVVSDRPVVQVGELAGALRAAATPAKPAAKRQQVLED